MNMLNESFASIENVLVQETGVGRFQVRAEAGCASFLIDEPLAFGGLGSGPTPYDLLSAALAACTAMTVRLYADRKAWPLEHVAVRVKHLRSSNGGQDQFDCELMVEGPLDDVQRSRLLGIANRCPVHLTLERAAQVRSQLCGPVVDDRDARSRGLHLADMVKATTVSIPSAA